LTPKETTAMKSVSYSERLKQDKKLYNLAERSTHLLEYEASKLIEDEVSSEWDVITNNNGSSSPLLPHLVVRMSDPDGWVTEEFSPQELERPDRWVFMKIRDLWTGLLREKSNRLQEARRAWEKTVVTDEN